MKSPTELILASTSPYRRELLGRLKIPFACIAPGIDETALAGEEARALAVRLACEKAAAVSFRHRSAWVIGSDQLAVSMAGAHQRILGKPGGRAACIDQLMDLSGQHVTFHTAVALQRQDSGDSIEFVDATHVQFRDLTREQIERYVDLDEPWDCAGGLKSESAGIALCESIRTDDPTALIGLPLIGLCTALRQAGFSIP